MERRKRRRGKGRKEELWWMENRIWKEEKGGEVKGGRRNYGGWRIEYGKNK